ncbi:13E12 repeat family protein [Mycobacterium tuberculosis variant bovis B2 7505]|nr:13E12 repeat family protein [Mycobacterium tuberculosis variant bovis B2 7505]
MDVSTRQAAEADLAGKAAQYRPDELARYAQRVMDWLHPDGDLTDTERARKRGITLSNQQYDGMSRLSGYLTPQARATFEAVLAKLAAPGATNPDDHTPVIDTTPDAAAIDRDTRSQAQRNHDGLLAGLRALIASGKLGQHNGLPVSIVVTTTLTDLQTGAGKGFTGGGTLLPMADVIRMTSHAHHYSPASGRYPQAIFDHGKPLALYHTKRLASPAQRIMLFANDRGCTKPGCDAPAYHSQAHHVTAWTSTGRTDITELTLACGPDNRTRPKRLDHPQKHPRPHRMATTTPPRPRPTPHQHLPPPREAATPQRRGQPRRSVRIAAREDLWTSPHRRASSPPGQHPPEPASWPLRRSCDQTPSPSSFLGPPHPSRYSARVLPSQRRKPANRPSIRDGRPAMRSARPNW